MANDNKFLQFHVTAHQMQNAHIQMIRSKYQSHQSYCRVMPVKNRISINSTIKQWCGSRSGDVQDHFQSYIKDLSVYSVKYFLWTYYNIICRYGFKTLPKADSHSSSKPEHLRVTFSLDYINYTRVYFQKL